MKSTIRDIDKEISVFVFITTICNFCTVMISLHAVFNPQTFADVSELIAASVFCVSIFFLFFVMFSAASKVAEASHEVGCKVWTMPEIGGNSMIHQLRFIMCAEKEIALTLWGITPIKRSLTFGIIGMTFTYALTFYNLNNQNDT
ncbi:uncharacterized protein TNIN_122171 [Trichonephila inaurata madagascariensis]|uniref:Uncharacterized protein n=1 Tax=Trichonephila inaurata madagascariensis TaxID=2747483 RepID=A0A8X6YUU6_9ARAC|nr:uncharacterized protein TNIN_122171 [Trichonephila inaurata madagascariensis]